MHPITICPAFEGSYEKSISESPSPILFQFTKFAQHLINFLDFGILPPKSLRIQQYSKVAQHLLFSYFISISNGLQSFHGFCPAPSAQKKFIFSENGIYFFKNN